MMEKSFIISAIIISCTNHVLKVGLINDLLYGHQKNLNVGTSRNHIVIFGRMGLLLIILLVKLIAADA